MLCENDAKLEYLKKFLNNRVVFRSQNVFANVLLVKCSFNLKQTQATVISVTS